jgi:hypothetical protein
VVPGRVGGLHMASEERGLYRLRTASDAPYMGAYGYGRHESFAHKLGAILAVVARMAAAVAVLLAWVAGVYLYRDTPISLYGDDSWLTASHLLIPVGFFCVFMTNRRYGPAYAFAQVVLTAIAIVAWMLFARPLIDALLPLDTIPTVREAAAFGGAFFAASFVSIVVFDGARGAHWWTAPLFGFLSAAIVYACVFFAALKAGTDAPWVYSAVEYMGALAGEGILLLIPFWMLRGMVRPISGFGGY